MLSSEPEPKSTEMVAFLRITEKLNWENLLRANSGRMCTLFTSNLFGLMEKEGANSKLRRVYTRNIFREPLYGTCFYMGIVQDDLQMSLLTPTVL